MISYAGELYFLRSGVPKIWNISWGTGSLVNANLVAESIEITEKLTSNGKFKLGDCVASQIEFQVGNEATALEGKNISVSVLPQQSEMTLQPLVLGSYKVVSDVPMADRRFRKITAYDAMHEILKADVTDWYNTILPDAQTTVTIKEFRDSFFQQVGITQVTQTLINDNVSIKRREGINQLSGKQVLNALCEINACFGHINRETKFQYIYLGTSVAATVVDYSTAKYENYITDVFTKVVVRSDQNDMGVSVGADSGATYVISGNFLTFSMTWEDLVTAATAVRNALVGVFYRPADIGTYGDPCVEVGDRISCVTTYCTIDTYVMQRKIKGLQWLRDSYSSKGEKNQKENINSTSAKINEISGRINEIKADLVTAISVVAQDLTADEARIGTIEANYVTAATVSATYATISDLNSATARIGTIEANYISAGTVAANYATISSLDAVSGRVGTLEATAITTSNLSAQSISAGQINSGTIDTARLNTGAIAAATVTASNICGALSSPGQGTITIGTIRVSSYQYYTGQGYTTLSIKTFTVGSTTYHCLGY